MNTNPLVSVCIPTYNGAAYLQEALDSILLQQYKHIEVVISDDASKDNTLEIIAHFKNSVDFPVRIYHHTPNGIGANWNNCIQHAEGEYIKFLFQDDVLRQDCIAKMVFSAEKYPSVGIVFSRRSFIYDQTDHQALEWIQRYKNLHDKWFNYTVKSEVNILGSKLLHNKNLLAFPENKIGEPTAVLIRKKVFDKVGLFSMCLKQTLDIEYWYRVMKYYDVLFIDEELISFRLHKMQATNINVQSFLDDTQQLHKNVYDTLFWSLHYTNKIKLFKEFNVVMIFLKRGINFCKRIKKKIYK